MATPIKFVFGAYRNPGVGHGTHTDRIMPKALMEAPSLSDGAEYRLRCVDYALATAVAEAVEVFKRSRARVYRWLRRYDPRNLRTLKTRSRRPKPTRTRQWSAEQEAALRLRHAHPCFGKAKLAVLLAAEGITLYASTIGRILTSLKRRNLLIEPRAVRVRHPKPARPYARRVPTDKRTPTKPGELIQMDTVLHLRPLPNVERRQFPAVDVVNRCAVVGVRGCVRAGTAAAFLDELVARMPFPVQTIQVDDRSELMADFKTACQERGIALYVLPLRSPKLNGRVERLNGTCRPEFWGCYGGELDLPTLQMALRGWETAYNMKCSHQSPDSLTPSALVLSPMFD